MRKFAVCLTAIALTACADQAPPPVNVAVNTLCTSTTRPVITDAQRAAFKADQSTWETLVNWLAGFLKVRDANCLKSSGAGD